MTNKNRRFVFVLVAIFGINFLLAEGKPPETTKDWIILSFALFGGLSLFLYGMQKMSEGLKKSAGNKMRSILAALTNNRFIGLSVGAFVTTIIQSSSATTVMLVSFVQARLMTFAQSLSMILGADIGTTITAQLVAFKLTDSAMLMIAIGYGLTMFSKKNNYKFMGEAILGFGILFYGMKFMGETMKPLEELASFQNFLLGLENPLVGLMVGAIFTAIVQSSSAFTGIIIVLAQQGLITLEAGIPLVFGANVGTCITAGLASIGTTRDAKRVAIAHVLFKLGGVALFIFWIPTFADIIRLLAIKFGSDIPRQIANAHTIFNVSLSIVFIPFTSFFAKVVMLIYPNKEEEKGVPPTVWKIDESSLETPATAIDLARNEIARMAKIMGKMLISIIQPFLSNDEQKDKTYPQLSLVEGIEMREGRIDYLEEHVLDYLVKIGRKELSEDQMNEVFAMMSIANDMESIGDIIQKNMIPLIAKKRALKMDFSSAGKEELQIFHIKICKQISRLKNAFAERDYNKAKVIMAKTGKYHDLESKYRAHHLKRIYKEKAESVVTHEIHMEIMDLLKQINVYTGSIAKTIFEIGTGE